MNKNKKYHIWAMLLALVYVFMFVSPIFVSMTNSQLMADIMGWIAVLVYVGAPIFYFWLFRQNKHKGYLAAAIVTLLILIVGIVSVVAVVSDIL